MRNIRTIEEALNLFEKNAIIQGEAIISGNYKICNKLMTYNEMYKLSQEKK